eukprot:Sspe_Gene.90184::Locus_61794_Transcript_1_1_Confidence_1.000_Length_1526::g.90184::m.90184
MLLVVGGGDDEAGAPKGSGCTGELVDDGGPEKKSWTGEGDAGGAGLVPKRFSWGGAAVGLEKSPVSGVGDEPKPAHPPCGAPVALVPGVGLLGSGGGEPPVCPCPCIDEGDARRFRPPVDGGGARPSPVGCGRPEEAGRSPSFFSAGFTLPPRFTLMVSPSLRLKSCFGPVYTGACCWTPAFLLWSVMATLKSKASPRSLNPSPMKACLPRSSIRRTKYRLLSFTGSMHFCAFGPVCTGHSANTSPFSSTSRTVALSPLTSTLHFPVQMRLFCQSAALCPPEAIGGILYTLHSSHSNAVYSTSKLGEAMIPIVCPMKYRDCY